MTDTMTDMVNPLPTSSPPPATFPPPEQASQVPQASRLSPSQRAYQADPEGFLDRLSERAGRLFEDGYRASPTDTPHVMAVSYDGGGGKTATQYTQYLVHLLERTCNCPFYTRQADLGEYLTPDRSIVPCKHQEGLRLLVRKTRRWLYENDRLADFCALWVHWMKTCAHLRRERIAAEKAQKAARAALTTTDTAGKDIDRCE